MVNPETGFLTLRWSTISWLGVPKSGRRAEVRTKHGQSESCRALPGLDKPRLSWMAAAPIAEQMSPGNRRIQASSAGFGVLVHDRPCGFEAH